MKSSYTHKGVTIARGTSTRERVSRSTRRTGPLPTVTETRWIPGGEHTPLPGVPLGGFATLREARRFVDNLPADTDT